MTGTNHSGVRQIRSALSTASGVELMERLPFLSAPLRRLERHPVMYGAVLSAFGLRRPIFIDHFTEPRPRFRPGSQPYDRLHELLARHSDRYASHLDAIADRAPDLARIPLRADLDGTEPYWTNGWLPPLDAAALYTMLATTGPARYVEIGSGNSTLMALKAIAANRAGDAAYTCDVTCIEPYEMPWLETTGVTVVRERVETVALARFADLRENDILFIDSSHVIRPYGDVLREFQDILPSLASGVLVHVHDIFSPRDYPEVWLRAERRLWNEQYLLEAFLAFNSRFSVLCANNWLKHNHWDAFSRACPVTTQANEPGSFWMRVNG